MNKKREIKQKKKWLRKESERRLNKIAEINRTKELLRFELKYFGQYI